MFQVLETKHFDKREILFVNFSSICEYSILKLREYEI